MRRRTLATEVAECPGRQVVAPDMREEKRSRESAANSASVVAEMEIPQHFDGYFGYFRGVPTSPDFDLDTQRPNRALERSRARAASISRSRGSAVVTRELMRGVAAAATSLIARS